jgi:hypothetical protein
LTDTIKIEFVQEYEYRPPVPNLIDICPVVKEAEHTDKWTYTAFHFDLNDEK